MTKEEKKKIRHLRALIRKNPVEWANLIDIDGLWDFSGVNMYDSKQQLEDLRENYDLIIKQLEESFGMPLEEMDEKTVKQIKRAAGKEAGRLTKAKAKEAGEAYALHQKAGIKGIGQDKGGRLQKKIKKKATGYSGFDYEAEEEDIVEQERARILAKRKKKK